MLYMIYIHTILYYLQPTFILQCGHLCSLSQHSKKQNGKKNKGKKITNNNNTTIQE